MKKTGRLLVLTMILMISVVGVASADCLSSYNHEAYRCQSLSFWEEVPCYNNAIAEYWLCVAVEKI